MISPFFFPRVLLFCFVVWGAAFALHARTFVHPGAPLTLGDLATLKTDIEREPWKTAFAGLASDSKSQPVYVMQGPFASVSRTPDVNLNQYKNDMQAAYNLALMWALTGDEACAARARDILLAWATTHVSMDGAEMYLTEGDYIDRTVGAADILRGTWSGWSEADTEVFKAYLLNVYWGGGLTAFPGPLRSANQGILQFVNALGVAVFCDDEEKFRQCLDAFRGDVVGGLANSLPNGEVGDSGRDQGHAYGQLLHLAWAAEVFWKQGVDVYADLENRLLAAGEYYARYNHGVETPYMRFGSEYDIYPGHGGAPQSSVKPPDFLNFIHGAYVVRKGMSAPWLERYRATRPETRASFMYRKSHDSSSATPLPPVPDLPAASVGAGLASADIGGATPAGSTDYAAGVWTVRGGGTDIGGSSDSFRFAYVPMTGDGAIIARVTSVENTHGGAKAGLMIRESLAANSAMLGIHLMPEVTVNGHTGPRVYLNMRGQVASSHGRTSQTHRMWDNTTVVIPYWLKLERRGARVSAFHSTDGASWSPMQNVDFAMGPTVYVGLCVASRVNGTLNTATFTDVRVTGGDGGEAPRVPEAPFAVYASPGNTQVPLRWLSSFGAERYHVKRSATPGGPYETIATVLGNHYIDSFVANGQAAYYVVTAENSAGESGPSLAAAVTPLPPMIRIEAEDRASQSGTQTEACSEGTLNVGYIGNGDWCAYPGIDFGGGVTEFQVRVAANNAAEDRVIEVRLDSLSGPLAATVVLPNTGGWQNWTTVSTTLTGATGLRAVYLRFLGSGTICNVNWFEYQRMDAPAPITPPGVPAGLAAAAPSATRVELVWAAAPDAAGYFVKRSVAADGPYEIVAAHVAGTAHTDTRVEPGEIYHYRVSALNTGGESADTASVAVSTDVLTAPENFTAVSVVSHIALSWDAVPLASAYLLKRAATPGGPYATLANDLATSTFLDASAVAGATYYYTVAARDEEMEGSASAVVSAARLYLSPALHIPFDETFGVIAADASGGDRAATLVNGAGRIAGPAGNAVLFAGSGQHATLPAGVVTGLSDFTISCWLRVDVAGTWARAFDFGTGTGNYLFLTPRHTNASGGMRFAIRTSASSAEQVIDGPVFPTGVWKHVAVTLSGATGTLYVDGVAAGTNPAMTLTPAALGPTDKNHLGRSQFSGDPYLQGALDEFQIHARALAAYEVAALATVLPAPSVPGAPQALAGAESATLNWSASSAAQSYAVFRSTVSGSNYTPIAVGLAEAAYLDGGLAPATTYYYAIAAINSSGASPLSPEVAVSTLTEWRAWRILHFGSESDPGIVAADADPDFDGVANLLEYALGGEPLLADPEPLSTTDLDEASRLRLTFARERGELVYVVEGSSDLVEWTPVATNPGEVGATVTVTDAEAPAPSRFLRLRVNGAEP